jgi:hypothetical protein
LERTILPHSRKERGYNIKRSGDCDQAKYHVTDDNVVISKKNDNAGERLKEGDVDEYRQGQYEGFQVPRADTNKPTVTGTRIFCCRPRGSQVILCDPTFSQAGA